LPFAARIVARAAAVAREEHDPLGHLRQGLQWQAEADRRSAEAAVYARFVELDVLAIRDRFLATNPPRDAIEKFRASLKKLEEVARPPGHPQSRWEIEALQELRSFAGEAPPLPEASSMAMTANETGRIGGTEAQRRRREAGELAWTADALRIAKDARIKDPHISTTDICKQIWNKCRSKGCPGPDEEGNPSRQLYRFIAKHEATEDGIPKRTLNKKRKAVRRRAT
jgi:hypothetical protein